MAARIWISGLTPIAVVIAVLGAGCDGGSQPSAPTPATALTVTSIAPSRGSSTGATTVTILGTGFEAGVAVTFSGTPATVVVSSPGVLRATTPAHAAGDVAVVVTNPGGASATLAQPYSYVQDPPPPSASLALTSLSPDAGSTDGGAEVLLMGSNFQPGARVTFDGVPVPLAYGGTQIMIAHPPAHAAGSVDVVVTNPDGNTARRVFSYASPGSFDFNGDWDAVVSGDAIVFRFTIRDNALASVTCRTAAPIAPTPAPVVGSGGFSFSGADGTSMSGRLVAPSQAIGEINMPVCGAISWFASRHE
jgi:uncharacterized protein (TIGR03437 family)